MIGFPAVQAFRTEPPFIDDIVCPAPNPDYATVLDSNVETASIRAKYAGRLNPVGGFFGRATITSFGPISGAQKGVPTAPNIPDAIPAFRHWAPASANNLH